MADHTPGPWTADGNIVRAPYNGSEYRTRVVAVTGQTYTWDHDEPKADARLIAAAPETAEERDEWRNVAAWASGSPPSTIAPAGFREWLAEQMRDAADNEATIADLLAALEATDKALGVIYERTEDEAVYALHLFVEAAIAAAKEHADVS